MVPLWVGGCSYCKVGVRWPQGPPAPLRVDAVTQMDMLPFSPDVKPPRPPGGSPAWVAVVTATLARPRGVFPQP